MLDLDKTRQAYIDAERQFRRAHDLMMYWTEETDQRNKAANAALIEWQNAQKEEVARRNGSE